MAEETVADRVRSLIGTQSERSFAQSIGIPPTTLTGVLTGSRPSIDKVVAIAKAAGVSVEWLATGEHFATGNVDPKYPAIPRYNASASAGAGAFTEYAERLDDIPFTDDFITKRLGRLNSDGLIIVDAQGDSMEPTISDGDLIMIDTARTQLTAAIYAFTYEDGFFVKRINHMPDAFEALSDNDQYPPFRVEREQMNRVNILGRVVWVGHTP